MRIFSEGTKFGISYSRISLGSSLNGMSKFYFLRRSFIHFCFVLMLYFSAPLKAHSILSVNKSRADQVFKQPRTRTTFGISAGLVEDLRTPEGLKKLQNAPMELTNNGLWNNSYASSIGGNFVDSKQAFKALKIGMFIIMIL